MKEKTTRDFLIRNMPLDVHQMLENAAKEHHRSKTQEAIVVLSNSLSSASQPLKKPTPFRWKSKPTSKFIKDAIREGRE